MDVIWRGRIEREETMRIVLENQIFYWEGGREKTCLLDCSNLMGNKSSIPMHSIQGEIRTIFDLVEELLNEEIRLERTGEEIEQFLLLNLLLIRHLISTSLPLKVLEIGCQDGEISYQFASILGEFHKDSTFYCMSDQMEIEWLKRMGEIKVLPHLSFLATDYEEALLEKEVFDIVLLNGAIQSKEPYQMIERALSFLKEKGSLIVISQETPFLESSFQLFFKKREEYRFSPTKAVLVGKKKNLDWQKKREEGLEKESQLIQKIKAELEKQFLDDKGWNLLIKEADHMVDQGMEEQNLDQKEQWLFVKEQMLDYLLYGESQERQECKETLKNYLKGLE